jgi:hypothetical protein
MSRATKKQSPRVRVLDVDSRATRALVGQINRDARTPEKIQSQTETAKQKIQTD